MQFLLLCSLGILSSAHAQNRPFRVQIGGNYAVFGNVSLDLKKTARHRRVFSVYAEERLTTGYGGGYGFDPTRIPVPTTRLDSFKGIGIALRQPMTRDSWSGLGLGGYSRSYRDIGSLDRDVAGLGGKIFAGYGRGVLIAEVSLIAPANMRNATLMFSAGVRL